MQNIINNVKHVVQLPHNKITDTHLTVLEHNIKGFIDVIVEEHLIKSRPLQCTHGVDRKLYRELEAVQQLSQMFSQNSPESKVFSQVKK